MHFHQHLISSRFRLRNVFNLPRTVSSRHHRSSHICFLQPNLMPPTSKGSKSSEGKRHTRRLSTSAAFSVISRNQLNSNCGFAFRPRPGKSDDRASEVELNF